MMWWMAAALAQQVVELPQGSTLASIRIRAMGGTCVSLAESATCHIANPASVVIRRPGDDNHYSVDSTIQLPDHPVYRALFGGDEPEDTNLHIRMQTGANVKVDGWGVGLHLRQDRWTLPGPDRGTLRWSLPLGWSTGESALAISPVMLVGQLDGAVSTGFGADAGGLLAIDGSPWRFGFGVHSPVRTALRDGQGLRTPARLTLAAGYGFGLRNASRTQWIDRVRSGDHWVQLHSELELIGASGRAVGLLDGEEAPAALTARFGAETDLWNETLRVRGGTYGLVKRATGQPELHVTGGATVHLFTFLQGTRWRGGGCVDWAASDTSIGIGLETW